MLQGEDLPVPAPIHTSPLPLPVKNSELPTDSSFAATPP